MTIDLLRQTGAAPLPRSTSWLILPDWLDHDGPDPTDVTWFVKGPSGRHQVRMSPAFLAVDRPPWREPEAHHGQPHYPGRYWAATVQHHLPYESLLELSILMLADMDPRITRIRTQPCLVSALVEGRSRSHVPDVAVEISGCTSFINVKPRSQLDEPDVRADLSWAHAAFASAGIDHSLATEQDPVVVRNVKFLAGSRRDIRYDPDLLAELAIRAKSSSNIHALEEASREAADHRTLRAHVLRALWLGLITTDLTTPLSGNSTLREER